MILGGSWREHSVGGSSGGEDCSGGRLVRRQDQCSNLSSWVRANFFALTRLMGLKDHTSHPRSFFNPTRNVWRQNRLVNLCAQLVRSSNSLM